MATRYRTITDESGVAHQVPLEDAGSFQGGGGVLSPNPLPTPKPLTGAQPLMPNITPQAPIPMTGPGPTLQRPNADTPGSLPTLQRPPVGGMTPAIAPPATGAQPLQPFGPGNDLRSTQINPIAGQRLQNTQAGTDVLFRSLAQGPSLSQAALDQYKLFGDAQGEERQKGIRAIGQANARFGRLGSGMASTDLGNLEERLGIADARERARLASGLAFAEGDERRANLGAGAAFENQLYGEGRGQRDELRGERAYQEDVARRAQDQEVMRRQLEMAYEQMLRQLGLQGAGVYGNQAAAGQGAAAELLSGALRRPRETYVGY